MRECPELGTLGLYVCVVCVCGSVCVCVYLMITWRDSCSFSSSCLTESSRFPRLLDEQEKFKCSCEGEKERTHTELLPSKSECNEAHLLVFALPHVTP